MSVRNALRRRVPRLLRFGCLRGLKPVSDHWGFDRGTPVDRYYIEQFLDGNRTDIRGRVLEIAATDYTDRFGEGVTNRDVLDLDPGNPRATIVADLSAASGVASDQFDCFILTQTLQFIYEVHKAVAEGHRLLRPGGVLLATVPSVSRIARLQADQDYWRFTVPSCTRLFGDVFGREHVNVRSYGNVLTSIAFVAGLASEELSRAELATFDESFPLIVAVRAVKSPSV